MEAKLAGIFPSRKEKERKERERAIDKVIRSIIEMEETEIEKRQEITGQDEMDEHELD